MYGKLPLGKIFEQHSDDEKNVLICPLKFQGTSADHTSVNQSISNNAVKPRMEASIKHTHFSIFTDSMHRNTISFISRGLFQNFIFLPPTFLLSPHTVIEALVVTLHFYSHLKISALLSSPSLGIHNGFKRS